MKIKIGPKWVWNPSFRVLEFYRQQMVDEDDLYNPKKQPKPDIVIGRYEYMDLLKFIEANEKGVVRTDRKEDLKLIHRLLDLLEKSK